MKTLQNLSLGGWIFDPTTSAFDLYQSFFRCGIHHLQWYYEEFTVRDIPIQGFMVSTLREALLYTTELQTVEIEMSIQINDEERRLDVEHELFNLQRGLESKGIHCQFMLGTCNGFTRLNDIA
jgi:hypothetical protein